MTDVREKLLLRASTVVERTRALLLRPTDARVAGERLRNGVPVAGGVVGRQGVAGGQGRGEGALPKEAACKWCRWSIAAQHPYADKAHCLMDDALYRREHRCANFEREPGADDE